MEGYCQLDGERDGTGLCRIRIGTGVDRYRFGLRFWAGCKQARRVRMLLNLDGLRRYRKFVAGMLLYFVTEMLGRDGYGTLGRFASISDFRSHCVLTEF